MDKIHPSELKIKESKASLKQTEEDLKVKDPKPEVAKAILNETYKIKHSNETDESVENPE